MAGRNYGYHSSFNNSPYSFGSSYVSGPSYYGNNLFGGYSSSSYSPYIGSGANLLTNYSFNRTELPRTKPPLIINSRISRPPSSLPSISETHATQSYTLRSYVPTLPTPPSISSYRLPPTPRTTPIVTNIGNIGNNYSRFNVRDTANINVTTRPVKRADPTPVEKESNLKRDFTVGTLKRGRRVIRLQTSRLPLDECHEESARSAGAASAVDATGTVTAPRVNQAPPPQVQAPADAATDAKPRQRLYGEPMPSAARVKKTPGQRLKEKFMLPSRKKKTVVAARRAPLQPDSCLVVTSDSGLGSSPVVTAATSMRDLKTNINTNTERTLHFSLLL